ncbi:hypothetical protein BHU72_00560 [Desulfuribacillus stibiiarsenatis]|uniref:PDZ domain-containing protein n=1 Tax=Desulfuribacillus stibiiarsenatis TaxID=1390249 RepID=A0A1E5L9I3_9FIRM|nr:PDZ domain-containing protein [Desulfuribacillus stibiiarsenatis]OEH86796.1 hypothetical protein BHU72_00560 [Desulfuribacillus stibiiarsenatis]
MFPFADIGLAILHNMKFLLLNPFIYVVILLITLQYRRMIEKERSMYSVRINSVADQTIQSIGFGFLGGLFATALLLVVGVVLNPYDMVYVWVVAVFVALINIRYLCFSYATGILGILAFVTMLLPNGETLPLIGGLWTGVSQLNVPMLIALVAILHLTEAMLIWIHGDKKASPVFLSGSRGKLVGGFTMQKFWLVPLFIIVAIDPASLQMSPSTSPDGGGTILFPDWWPLLPLSTLLGSGVILGMLPVPAVLGYGDIAVSRTPRQKAKQTAKWLALYSVVLLMLGLVSQYSPWLLLLAALFSAVAHESIIVFTQRKEFLDTPMYSKPLKGVRILQVLPNSTAQKLGLTSGEVILKVNGFPIYHKSELHYALSLQPVYVKLEIEDLNGEIKFAQTALYQGEHHSLGIILVPDDDATHYVKINIDNPLKMLWKKFRR